MSSPGARNDGPSEWKDAATVLTGAGLPTDPVRASGDRPFAEHVRAALDRWTRLLAAREAGILRGRDPEDLHRGRVAVRRMRAVLRTGRDSLDRTWCSGLRAELGWLGRELGPVRDLDVQLAELDRLRTELEQARIPALEQLRAALGEHREHARSELLEALRTERYRALLVSLATAVRDGVPATGAAEPGARVLRRKLGEQLRAVHEKGRDMPAAPEDSRLHGLRIAVKRLRYCAELAVPVLEEEPPRRVMTAAERLQDVLGQHQDAVVTEQWMRRLVGEGTAPGRSRRLGPESVLLAEEVVRRCRLRRERLRTGWAEHWRELVDTAAAWSEHARRQ
ncbi:CHAD domain-containing protein [Actinopolyspora mortivallis]|uniref:CHAD domain-containing protein n=1 Tax=Actinopolyspora mortivallis TaxID=33906 RepID=UPI00035CCC19|nr:CHAD domain-containing protein [Actinopolyspora mortivallis]